MTYILTCAMPHCPVRVPESDDYRILSDYCDMHRAQVLAALDRDFPPESDNLVDDVMRFAGKFLTKIRG